MNFKFQLGTAAFFGAGAVKNNPEVFGKYGTKAFIVTGPRSGQESGALDDVKRVLQLMDITYSVFDKIENNPSLDNVEAAGKAAQACEADLIIGIGGGSPLDAAKAVAVLAVNDISPIELFTNKFTAAPLPVIAIPTTAGTGSEVTPYSILTRPDKQTKMSFGNEDTIPKAAFLDARYTASASYEVTVNTAVDALSHAVEGYLSRRSTPVSDLLALEAIRIFGGCAAILAENKLDFDAREQLLYASTLGGMVIAQTGTTIVHGLGYSLTFFKGLPHGLANGLLMQEYFKYNYPSARNKIDRVIQELGLTSIDEFGSLVENLMPTKLKLSAEEMQKFAELAMQQRSTSYNIREVQQEHLVEILGRCFG
ncbi:MAG: iron-containing alcohol dehydrogenase family protein [Candidatus Saccharibacteria bacterium]